MAQLQLRGSRKAGQAGPRSLLDQGPQPDRRRIASAPGILAQEIADDLEAALELFTKIAARLGRPA